MTYLSNGTEYQTWNLETIGDTRIKVADFDVLLVDREGEADFIEHIESDEYIEDTKSNESDIWVLIEQECENDVEPKSIYIETQVNEK